MHWLTSVAVVAILLFILTLWLGARLRQQADDHKKMLKKLQESEQCVKLMADNATCMVLAYDMDRKLLFASPAVERLTGYSASDLQEEGFLGWVHPEDWRRMKSHREYLFRGGAYLGEEYRLVAKNGRVKWVSASWSPILDKDGHQTGVQGCEHEITARKHQEQARRESERRFRVLLESVQLAAVTVNLKGNVSFCNDYALALTGWTRDEVIGHPAHQFFDAEDRHQLIAAIEAAQETGRPQTPCEGAVLTRDGGRRWLRWNSFVLRDAGGQTVGFASVGADLTAHLAKQVRLGEHGQK